MHLHLKKAKYDIFKTFRQNLFITRQEEIDWLIDRNEHPNDIPLMELHQEKRQLNEFEDKQAFYKSRIWCMYNWFSFMMYVQFRFSRHQTLDSMSAFLLDNHFTLPKNIVQSILNYVHVATRNQLNKRYITEYTRRANIQVSWTCMTIDQSTIWYKRLVVLYTLHWYYISIRFHYILYMYMYFTLYLCIFVEEMKLK